MTKKKPENNKKQQKTPENVKCSFDKMVDIDLLVPHPDIPNEHS